MRVYLCGCMWVYESKILVREYPEGVIDPEGVIERV